MSERVLVQELVVAEALAALLAVQLEDPAVSGLVEPQVLLRGEL